VSELYEEYKKSGIESHDIPKYGELLEMARDSSKVSI
jgi:hypothetical protein